MKVTDFFYGNTTLGYAKAQQKVKEAHASYNKRRQTHTSQQCPSKNNTWRKILFVRCKQQMFFKVVYYLMRHQVNHVLSHFTVEIKVRCIWLHHTTLPYGTIGRWRIHGLIVIRYGTWYEPSMKFPLNRYLAILRTLTRAYWLLAWYTYYIWSHYMILLVRAYKIKSDWLTRFDILKSIR